MSELKLSREDLERVVPKLKAYLSDELDQDIGSFEAEFLLDFIAKEIGPAFYNRGLADAQALFVDKANELSYLIEELEKPSY